MSTSTAAKKIAVQGNNSSILNITRRNAEFKQKHGMQHLPGIGEHVEFLGRTGSGKSSAEKAMIHEYYRDLFDEIFVMAPTAKLDNWSELGIPQSNLIDRVTEVGFNRLIIEAMDKFEYSSKGRYNWATLIIIDDMGSALKKWVGKWRSSKGGDEGFVDRLISARHYGVSIHLLVQDPMFLSPDIRANIHANSISTQFTKKIDLERVCAGKSIPCTRGQCLFEGDLTLEDAIKQVRKINDTNKSTYGRVFYSSVNGAKPAFFYQDAEQFALLEPEEVIKRKVYLDSDSDTEEHDSEDVKPSVKEP